MPEEVRVSWFRKLQGQWPPLRTYPGGQLREETETPGWRRLMENFETEARNEKTSAGVDRVWARWLELAQMRFARNYTERGWILTRMNEDIHGKVLAAWQGALKAGGVEQEHEVDVITGKREFWHIKNLDPGLWRRLLVDVQSKLAAWVGISDRDRLELTAFWGMRSYLNGSVLVTHVDRVATHVLAAVYCVEVRQPAGAEPWYIGTEADYSGEPAWVDLRGGELFLYEAAKLPHGRPKAFVGERYTAIFIHFRPSDWDLEESDRIFAVPPDFREPRPRNEEL